MEKRCGNCGNYEVFYGKGYCEFIRKKYGYCCVKQGVMGQEGACECWRMRRKRYRDITRGTVLRALEKGLTDIAALRQIFAENDDSEKQ